MRNTTTGNEGILTNHAAMPVQSFPVEISLMIIYDIFNSQKLICHTFQHSDRLLHQAVRTQRLAWFRTLACVCKAWADPARTAFWTEVTLFTAQEIIALARDIKSHSAKPACIRRLSFRLPSQPHHHPLPPDYDIMKEEAQRSLLVILRQLPAHLDFFSVNCDQRDYVSEDILYDSLKAACTDGNIPEIDITRLDIDSPPGIQRYDIFRYFTFPRNIVHLVLLVDCSDFRECTNPIPPMQLESLVLHVDIAGGTWHRGMAIAAGCMARMLQPACTMLQLLTLNLRGYDDTLTNILITAINEFLSLGSPSMTVLNLCAKPVIGFIAIAQELADGDAFPPCPALRHLHLDQFDVSPNIFRQMCCSVLRQLEVTVTEIDATPTRDGVGTMWEIMNSLELKELHNLEDLIIHFGKGETLESDEFMSRGPSTARTEQVWEPLKRACAVRNINCIIYHPD